MKKLDEKLMGISGSVPPSLHAAMEDARWGYKKNMSQFVRLAVESFAISEGFWTPDEPVEVDESTLTDAQREAIAADEARAEAARIEALAAEDDAAKAEREAAAKAEADAKAAADAADGDAADGDAADDKAAPETETPTKSTSRSRK